jgi:hypothetical protein
MNPGTLLLDVIAKLEEAIDFHDLKARGQLPLNTLPCRSTARSACARVQADLDAGRP